MNTIQLEQLINYSFQYDELERLLKTSIDGFASNIQKTLDGIYNNYSLYDKINVDEYLLPQMGDELFKKGDFIRALDIYDQALQINPDNFKANLGKANSLRATQKYLEAEKFYIKAKSQKQNDSVLLFGFGECLRQQMKIDKAIIEYDLAVQIDENYDEAAFYLGVCHIYLGIWRVQFKGEDGGTIKNELFSYFKRISTLGYDGTYKTLSNALFLSLDGYFQEAIKMIEQVLKTSPQNYEALLLISFLLFGNENYNLSLEFLEKIETQDLLILFLKSLCLLCIDLQNSSIKLLDKILDSTPGNQYAQMFKGVCLLKIKQPKEALAIFNTILEAYPQNEDAKSYKDQCLKEIGDENETNQDQELQI
ncbi:unnamed protein product [Paramecium octaurelia]|uniref:Tetratricopeptide repeat protein n=1 Tax=Paramecium octaurelia TaxID=43137 RepID=A0A8S1YM15_PAROT|nr:unnamed protein product [Paramecium octaurelia]